MCGFSVAIIKDIYKNGENVGSKMNQSLENISHRGPDASGILKLGSVTLGHRRLSIIDVTERANQPLTSTDGRYHIVFNGEIFNYKDIRPELDGWTFRTDSDTEVLLAAYDKWGIRCFSRFLGQFAVCIYDVEKNQLIISRDMMGEKPLYVHSNEQGVFYSSEIRGLIPFMNERPSIDFIAFNDYMHYQYIPEPNSIIKGTSKVEAGTIIRLDLETLETKCSRLWDWRNPKIDTTPITIRDVEKKLKDAIQYSLVADVSVALGLSSGLDSSAIALYAKEAGVDLSSYTIGYPGKPAYDERDGAASLAKHLGIKNTQIEIEPGDFIDDFEEYCDALSEPIADTAGYGHYTVPQTIAKYGHKVMLSGIGGDEIFWGYEWTRLAIQYEEIIKFSAPEFVVNMLRHTPSIHKVTFKMSRWPKVPETLRGYFRLLHTLLIRTTPKDQTMFMGITGAPEFTSQLDVGGGYYGALAEAKITQGVYRHTTNITDPSTTNKTIVNLLSKLNRTWLISNCVQLADTLSMSNSIECRAPFLNSDLVKTMLAFNTQNRADRKGSKAVLREIMANKFPAELLNRPKAGFVTPVVRWVKLLEAKYADLINNGKLVEQGLIKKNFFKSKDMKNVTLHTKYRLILLEIWYSNLINKYT